MLNELIPHRQWFNTLTLRLPTVGGVAYTVFVWLCLSAPTPVKLSTRYTAPDTAIKLGSASFICQFPLNGKKMFHGNEISRCGSSPKILGSLPPQLLHHRVHFLRSPKPKKYEFIYRPTFEIYHYGCQFCNGLTLRPVETRPEGPRAGVGFLGGGERAPSPSTRGSGGAL